ASPRQRERGASQCPELVRGSASVGHRSAPSLFAASGGWGIAATPPALAEDRMSGASRGESGARQEAARSVRRGDAPPSRRSPRIARSPDHERPPASPYHRP